MTRRVETRSLANNTHTHTHTHTHARKRRRLQIHAHAAHTRVLTHPHPARVPAIIFCRNARLPFKESVLIYELPHLTNSARRARRKKRGALVIAKRVLALSLN